MSVQQSRRRDSRPLIWAPPTCVHSSDPGAGTPLTRVVKRARVCAPPPSGPCFNQAAEHGEQPLLWPQAREPASDQVPGAFPTDAECGRGQGAGGWTGSYWLLEGDPEDFLEEGGF